MARGSGPDCSRKGGLFQMLGGLQVALSQLSRSSEGALHPTAEACGRVGSHSLFSALGAAQVCADELGGMRWGPPLRFLPLTFCSKLSGVRKKLCRGTK